MAKKERYMEFRKVYGSQEVRVKIDGDANLETTIAAFEDFLRGAGYHLAGPLNIEEVGNG